LRPSAPPPYLSYCTALIVLEEEGMTMNLDAARRKRMRVAAYGVSTWIWVQVPWSLIAAAGLLIYAADRRTEGRANGQIVGVAWFVWHDHTATVRRRRERTWPGCAPHAGSRWSTAQRQRQVSVVGRRIWSCRSAYGLNKTRRINRCAFARAKSPDAHGLFLRGWQVDARPVAARSLHPVTTLRRSMDSTHQLPGRVVVFTCLSHWPFCTVISNIVYILFDKVGPGVNEWKLYLAYEH
jgi:hypothetical protein